MYCNFMYCTQNKIKVHVHKYVLQFLLKVIGLREEVTVLNPNQRLFRPLTAGGGLKSPPKISMYNNYGAVFGLIRAHNI